MHIFIEPSDVLLFRDGRSFISGEDHLAVSLFPPTPLTMQGVIRSKVLADKGVSYAAYATGKIPLPEIGHAEDYGQLCLRGPFLARREKGKIVPYFPVPADVVTAGYPHPVVLAPLPANESPFQSNLPDTDAAPLLPLWQRTTAHLEPAKGWLSEHELRRYLSGQPFTITPEEQLFQREPRFHVGLDYTSKCPYRGDTGGHLFQIEFIRPGRDTGLWLEVRGVNLAKNGLLQLGGEGKAAYYEEVANPSLLTPGGKAKGRFKLYFATPAYFATGWQPDNWGKFIGGGSVRLIAAALPRAQPLGGFDMARRLHKPMRRFVPPGSVFFFESDDEVTVPEVITNDQGKARLGQIGFGQVFIGRWDYV